MGFSRDECIAYGHTVQYHPGGHGMHHGATHRGFEYGGCPAPQEQLLQLTQLRQALESKSDTHTIAQILKYTTLHNWVGHGRDGRYPARPPLLTLSAGRVWGRPPPPDFFGVADAHVSGFSKGVPQYLSIDAPPPILKQE